MKPALAVDLGTTMIEVAVVIGDDGAISGGFQSVDSRVNQAGCADTTRFENPARLYGADVLSRMNNAVRFGLSDKMRAMMRDAIRTQTTERLSIEWSDLSHIVLSGNTPMQHLFFGLDVSGMTDAPFTPESLGVQRGALDGVPVLSFPGISAFVGGDIVSGLYALDLFDVEAPTLFVDLGTNGEIVLILPDKTVLATSVAAGPSFEGGNISIGMPALPGAIDGLSIRRGFCRIHTIDDVLPPKGLCGSGLIEAVYELYKDGIIDDHGSFISDDFRENGFPLYAQNFAKQLLLTQHDIRAMQVAKAAVSAGIEALVELADLPITAGTKLYLAGSFGQHLNIKKAAGIGLIPEAFLSKTILAGNTSLAGAIKLSRHPDDIEEILGITTKAKSVSLADSSAFKEAYIKNMDLPAIP